MARFPTFSASWTSALVSFLVLLSAMAPSVQGQQSEQTIQGTNAAGVTNTLLLDRYPALYSGSFGDCMGGQSLLNLTSFDAAYYADNMTVLFNLAGTSNLRNESLMLYIEVEAYGENRFDLTFNPCSANFASLCPLNASIPIRGGATIPVSQSDVSGIPPIALSIPDFEGSVTLRIFSNQSQTEIGCFQAEMRNGVTLSHPAAVASVLGIFTATALISSFATAIYGVSVPHIRTHYAHSLSVLVVFEVFQSVFFSGALSLNWPSVCAAFWSNFAWSAGMIYAPSLMDSVNSFVGVAGNSSQVGGAGSAVLNNNGGLQQQIYGRALGKLEKPKSLQLLRRGREFARRFARNPLMKRAVGATKEREYAWAGLPVYPGLPVPGKWSGFAGTLSQVQVPAADAFLIGLLWFMILLAILIGAIVIFKYTLEALGRMKWIKEDRLALFRTHWLRFMTLMVLRAMFIAFFMMTTLSLFQFSYGGSAGVTAVATIVFFIFFAGMFGLSFYACFYRLRFGKYQSSPDRLHFQRKKSFPFFGTVMDSKLEQPDKPKTAGSMSFFRIDYIDNDAERQTVHEDQDYTKRFGWLSARYRLSRWWFFAIWVVYQFVRACFIGGARASPTAQVFGIFIWEIIAFIVIIKINPFEGARNTALAVWMLGISKVATAGLSIAFLPQFKVARIPTTVIGVIIIVIQGFLVIGLMILIALSALSSYMSVSRNSEQFKPRGLEGIRLKYFDHIEQKATDMPPPAPPQPEEPKEPYFDVKNVRRAPKIEDEDVDFVSDLADVNNPAGTSFSPANRISRPNSVANSLRSHYSGYGVGNAPYGARVHRTSWSSRDFQGWHEDQEGGGRASPSAYGAPSRRMSGHISQSNSVSKAPLVRPMSSIGSMRPSTPTREQQRQFSSQRFAAPP